MSSQLESKHNVAEPEPIGCIGLVARMFWLLFGNLALFMLAILILKKPAFSVFDIAYWAIVAGLILVRYLDITRVHGLTSDSEPATLKHWRIYVVKLLLISGLLWGLAHIKPFTF